MLNLRIGRVCKCLTDSTDTGSLQCSLSRLSRHLQAQAQASPLLPPRSQPLNY